jgi:hypothetical protein
MHPTKKPFSQNNRLFSVELPNLLLQQIIQTVNNNNNLRYLKKNQQTTF